MTHLDIDCFFFACCAVGYAVLLFAHSHGEKHYERDDHDEYP